MSVKLIATDFDGTILIEGEFKNQKDIETIKKLQNQDLKFIGITGQPYYAAVTYCQQMHMDKFFDLIVAENGAYISKISKQEPIRSLVIDNEVILQLEKTVSQNKENVCFCISSDEKVLYIGSNVVVAEILKHPWFKNWQTKHIQESATRNIHQLTIICNKEIKDEIDEILNEHRDIVNWTFDESNGKLFYTVNHIDASKGKALKFLSEYFNIPLSDIMVFGDGSNDISMFQIAGTSVAMGNSIAELKAIATYTTDTVQNNGVSLFLEKYFIHKED
jgi:Cof subfamily protein (haloacid dehalogenase superfamily)